MKRTVMPVRTSPITPINVPKTPKTMSWLVELWLFTTTAVGWIVGVGGREESRRIEFEAEAEAEAEASVRT